MSSRRTAKVAEAVREEVSTTILFGLKDPRVKNVTVTRVEVSSDLKNAKVYVSVMGDEKMQRLSLRGLESARGFLQAKLAERLQIRYTPILRFELDQGIKRSIEASRLLREVLPPAADAERAEPEGDEEQALEEQPAADEDNGEVGESTEQDAIDEEVDERVGGAGPDGGSPDDEDQYPQAKRPR
jgi:ribosome-binding factor A